MTKTPGPFSNQVGALPPSRAAFEQALAEVDRQATLPAGHPEVLRAWGADAKVPVPADLWPLFQPRCRVCGCTDDDCSECVRVTGGPCHWVEPDLCSACVTPR